MCLGGCTITSKTKINIFWKEFSSLQGPSIHLIKQKTVDFSLWGKQCCIVLAKRTYFRSLAHSVQWNESCTKLVLLVSPYGIVYTRNRWCGSVFENLKSLLKCTLYTFCKNKQIKVGYKKLKNNAIHQISGDTDVKKLILYNVIWKLYTNLEKATN